MIIHRRWLVFCFLFLVLISTVTKSFANVKADNTSGDTPPREVENANQVLNSPIEEDDTHFIADSGGNLDQYLYRNDIPDGILKFDIQINRFYFNVQNRLDQIIDFDSDGFLTPASLQYVIGKNILPETVKLRMRVYDVDEDDPTCAELDLVHINDELLESSGQVARLSGANETWSEVSYDVPISMLKFPQNRGMNAAPTPATNEIGIEIDANQCLYLGQPAWAVEVDYGILEIEGPIRPIVFAHGWTGTIHSFDTMEDRLKSDGIPSGGQADLQDGLYPIPETAGWLNNFILNVAKEYGVDKINLFAHSKGGLVSRRTLYDSTIAKMVEHLVTFDSPHHGTWVAENKPFVWLFCNAKYFNDANKANLCTKAAKEFTTDAARETFNYSGCTYSIFTGWSNCIPIYIMQPEVDYRAFAALGSPIVIPKATAQYPWFDSSPPLPILFSHIDAGYFSTHAGLLDRQGAYECAIYLLSNNRYSQSSCPNSIPGSEEQLADQSQNDFEITANQFIFSQAENLTSSGLFNTSVTYDSGTQLILDTYADTTVEFTLVEPGGRLITPEVAITDPLIEYSTDSDFGLNHYLYVINSPLSGPWGINIQSDSAVNFVISGLTASPVSLELSSDKTSYHPGETITVQTALIENQNALTGSMLDGEFEQPDGTFLPVIFYDDGTHGDLTAGDGVFTARFVAPSTQNNLFVKVNAALDDVHREKSLLLSISSQTASIIGVSNEWTTDDDNDGFIDTLILQVEINVLQSGYFDLQGSLVDTNSNFVQSGQYLSRTENSTPLTPGTHSFLLKFDGEQFWNVGEDGPYTLTQLILTDSSNQIFEVDKAEAIYVTQAYSVGQFEHPLLRFDSGTESAVDLNGNNRYDTLTFHLQFSIDVPGSYTVNGRLLDPNGSEIAWSSTDFYVSSSNTYSVALDFVGSDIGEHQVNGPYTLEDVSLFNQEATAGSYFSSLISTEAYNFTQFENGFYKIRLPIVTSGLSSPTTGFNWLDAHNGGTIVAQGDDTYEYISLPFTLNFYGNNYAGLYVSSNGFVSFEAGYSSFSNSCIPSISIPNNAIYGFWDDLVPTGSGNGNIYVKGIDANTYVIEWYQVRKYGTSNYFTFEIVLKSDSSITLQYQTILDTGSATVGVENMSGTLAQQFRCNGIGTPVTNYSAILYSTP